jgi:hypothetical protein
MSQAKANAAVTTAGPRPRRLIPASLSKGTATQDIDGVVNNPSSSTLTPSMKITAPQPLLPPDGFKPSIHTGPEPDAKTEQNSPQTATAHLHSNTVSVPTQTYVVHHEKKKLGNGAKIGMAIAVAGFLGVAGFIVANQIKASNEAKHYIAILDEAASGSSEITMTTKELNHLLADASTVEDVQKFQAIIQALAKAKPTDGGNFDSIITKYVTENTQLLQEPRINIINQVLGKRANPSSASALIEFARSTKDNKSAVAAFGVISLTAGDDNLETLLAMIEFAPEANLRKAAEDASRELLRRSENRKKVTDVIGSRINATPPPEAKFREVLTKLLAAAGGR